MSGLNGGTGSRPLVIGSPMTHVKGLNRAKEKLQPPSYAFQEQKKKVSAQEFVPPFNASLLRPFLPEVSKFYPSLKL